MASSPHIPTLSQQTSRREMHRNISKKTVVINEQIQMRLNTRDNKCERWHLGGLSSGAEATASEWYLGRWLGARRFCVKVSGGKSICCLPNHLCTQYLLCFHCALVVIKCVCYLWWNILISQIIQAEKNHSTTLEVIDAYQGAVHMSPGCGTIVIHSFYTTAGFERGFCIANQLFHLKCVCVVHPNASTRSVTQCNRTCKDRQTQN